MTEDRLTGVRQTLETELERVEDEVTRLKAELAAAEAERKPLAAALTALGKKKPAKPSKPAPKKDQVLVITTELLEANGPMPLADLEELIKERLTELGVSHNGFGLRLGGSDEGCAARGDGGAGRSGVDYGVLVVQCNLAAQSFINSQLAFCRSSIAKDLIQASLRKPAPPSGRPGIHSQHIAIR